MKMTVKDALEKFLDIAEKIKSRNGTLSINPMSQTLFEVKKFMEVKEDWYDTKQKKELLSKEVDIDPFALKLIAINLRLVTSATDRVNAKGLANATVEAITALGE
jgi:hypothetical protein